MEHDHSSHRSDDRRPGPRVGPALFFWVLLGIGVTLLVLEHRAHLLGVLPYLLLLACLVMHFFMHGGHGGHDSAHRDEHQDNQDNG